MTLAETTLPTQSDALSFEFDLEHEPAKVWRALTNPELLAQWLLPVMGLELDPGAEFTFKTEPVGGWDGVVNCRVLESETERRLKYTWVVGDMDTVVTFTLSPTATGTRLSPLPPLALLLFTGLYMFALPHAAKWRNGRSPQRGGLTRGA